MNYVTGGNRDQIILMSERIEDYVSEESPVRVIDVYVDESDLNAMGFRKIQPNKI